MLLPDGWSRSFLPTRMGRLDLARHPLMDPFAKVVCDDLVLLVACVVSHN